MTVKTILFKLPERLPERLEAATRADGPIKSSLLRERPEQTLDVPSVGGEVTSGGLPGR